MGQVRQMSAAIQIEIIQGSAAWLDWRKGGVGASDVAALFEKSPYKTKRDLWFEKQGLGKPEDEDRSYIFARGHETEAELRDLLSKHTKIALRPTCFQKDEIFRSSLDGHEKSFGILEAKFVGKEVLKKAAETGEIPEHHRIQVQAQLHGSDEDKAFWAARAPSIKTGVVVEIGRDEKLIKEIIGAVESFWEQVTVGAVPELSAKDTLFVTDPMQVSMLIQLRGLKSAKEKMDQEYADLEEKVKGFAFHPRTKWENVTISQVNKPGAIDYLKVPEIKQLKKEYLEGFRRKFSTYKRITFGKS